MVLSGWRTIVTQVCIEEDMINRRHNIDIVGDLGEANSHIYVPTKYDPCPACGLNRVIVGRAHNCRPRPKTLDIAATVFNSGLPQSPVSLTLDMPSELSDKNKPSPIAGFDRKAYQREYMRKRRAKV